jgi:LacI family transcriptional regulator
MAGGRLTIKDVARIAGVGVGTVSRVLNNHKSVDPAVRAHVLESIRTLNYEPDAQACDLRRGATSTVGMIVRDRTMKHVGRLRQGGARSAPGRRLQHDHGVF